ncbi:MAG TPA: alpha/beta hydrolase [Candidatus Saccharimonadales bacterium]|nr:alpha/beta hydrolase [Candidatus Saccharimonadales bacterium]
MNLIQTRSFQLAAYIRGDINSVKLALVLPGRLDTKDYAHMRSAADYLSSKDYYAVSFDPPGTWESPGNIDLYTVTNYHAAINELIEYFGNRSTLLVGHSNGGKLAMLVGTTNPHVKLFVAAMALNGPTTVDLPTATGEVNVSYRDIPPGTSRTSEQQKFELPFSYFEDQQQYDALEDLKKCTKPKLFFYGTKDVLSTPEQVQNMFEATAEPKEIHEVNSEHDYRLHADIMDEVNQTIGKFIEKYETV